MLWILLWQKKYEEAMSNEHHPDCRIDYARWCITWLTWHSDNRKMKQTCYQRGQLETFHFLFQCFISKDVYQYFVYIVLTQDKSYSNHFQFLTIGPSPSLIDFKSINLRMLQNFHKNIRINWRKGELDQTQ